MCKEESISETNPCVIGVFGAGKSFLGSRHKLCLHLLLTAADGSPPGVWAPWVAFVSPDFRHLQS